MLETLRIQNYALIDAVEIEFPEGFTALTGETGAGKSIIVDALNLVLGARASSEAVREGAKRAKVDAMFRVASPSKRLAALLREHDIEPEDEELLLSRVVTTDGRSRAYAAGNLVPVGILAQIGDELVDMHGQHEHQSLLKTDRQLELLDGFADTEEAAAAVADQVQKLRAIERAIAELESHDRERERRLEFLRFELAEINGANLVPGEEDELKTRRSLIANAEQVVSLTAEAYTALYESDGAAAIDGVDTALRALGELARIDPRLKESEGRLETVRSELDDLARDVQAYATETDFDPAELDTLNERLATISELKRKYGGTVEAILEYRDKARDELERYDQRDERLTALREERTSLMNQAETASQALSKKRRAAARKLDKQVTANLHDLGMKGGVFETRIETRPLASDGIDKIAFLLAANAGERPKALRQVASGGEISRVMLALKTVFAHADHIPTLIFDEIDAGVGGAIASRVAATIKALADSHQTICITHLPQIAAVAQAHYTVEKGESNGRTTTHAHRIEGTDRETEIARLLDGSVSPVSLEHARDLLQRQHHHDASIKDR